MISENEQLVSVTNLTEIKYMPAPPPLPHNNARQQSQRSNRANAETAKQGTKRSSRMLEQN